MLTFYTISKKSHLFSSSPHQPHLETSLAIEKEALGLMELKNSR